MVGATAGGEGRRGENSAKQSKNPIKHNLTVAFMEELKQIIVLETTSFENPFSTLHTMNSYIYTIPILQA